MPQLLENSHVQTQNNQPLNSDLKSFRGNVVNVSQRPLSEENMQVMDACNFSLGQLSGCAKLN